MHRNISKLAYCWDQPFAEAATWTELDPISSRVCSLNYEEGRSIEVNSILWYLWKHPQKLTSLLISEVSFTDKNNVIWVIINSSGEVVFSFQRCWVETADFRRNWISSHATYTPSTPSNIHQEQCLLLRSMIHERMSMTICWTHLQYIGLWLNWKLKTGNQRNFTLFKHTLPFTAHFYPSVHTFECFVADVVRSLRNFVHDWACSFRIFQLDN